MDDKLRKIQLCQLEILKEVVRICDKHGIDYWLAYGTMLGAVRHKGFIPWDDDLDIYMTMQGFRRFQKVCKTELSCEYFLQTPETEPTMGWLFYKVRKNGTRMLESHQNGEYEKFNYGIWIDIFPLINLNQNEKCRKIQYSILKKLQYYRGCHPGTLSKAGLKTLLKRIYSKALWVYEKILWRIVFMLGGRDSDELMVVNSQFYPHIKNTNYEGKIFKSSYFRTFEEYDFEGYVFKGISDYDSYLKKCYSENYMTPRKYNTHVDDYSKVIV